MKQRFNTYDIICSVTELQKLVGMRVNQVYDIDNKTYLIRLQRTEEKCVLLIESGNRFHTTAFEWPKNVAPSGFSMKMRKHLKNKRLESLRQLGIDRIVDFQFGTGEAAYHVILELYDRGNIILTDFNMTILNILRPHTEGEVVKFVVREKYPENRARLHSGTPSSEFLADILSKAKPGDNLRRALNPYLEYGPAVIDHVLLQFKLSTIKIKGEAEQKNKQKQQQEFKKGKNKPGKVKHVDKSSKQSEEQKDNKVEVQTGHQDKEIIQTKEKVIETISKKSKDDDINIYNESRDLPNIYNAIVLAEELVQNAMKTPSKGYIIQKKEARPTPSGEETFFYSNQDYHPYLFMQFSNSPYKELDSFDVAVDEFYSTLEGQKIDLKAVQQEREALKKLSNVRADHEKRLKELESTQEIDKHRAELITRNQQLVDNAILAIQSAVANQMSWPDISALVKAAQNNGDPIASVIKQLKLEINHITLFLTDPYTDNSDSEDENEEDDALPKSMLIDIDLALSAYANATRYYDQKRSAAKKQQKTLESQGKALKSAEKKTKQTLKEVQAMTTISKARKAFWFEKFYWFITSENYLVIGGRDQQQNEQIVKRYLRGGDVYVHADVQGASSVIIKNPSGGSIPPKTLNEAGTMAIAYSVAWDAKVVISSWWVNSDQVSKTAPAGEYLSTGSFMIRGKKNYLPPSQLALGLSFLFKLEDSSIERHKGERRVRTADNDLDSDLSSHQELEAINEEEIELEGPDSESEEGEKEPQSSKEINEVSEDVEPEVTEFPDIQLKFDYGTGKVEILRDSGTIFTKKKEDDVVYLGDDVAVLVTPLPQKIKQGKKKNLKQADIVVEPKENIDENKEKHSQVKRGQKGKLKKIKDKYKYQDEEERQLRMDILQSAGSGKENKKSKKSNTKEGKQTVSKPRPHEQKQQQIIVDQNEDGDQEIEAEKEVEIDMLDSLSGIPVAEDELLFAIPVIAPYNTLTNYKYKVKLTPGTGRRGKAARTAVSMFVREKNCTQREKDLIRSVKDDVLARNIPGKVKLSAPHLHKHK